MADVFISHVEEDATLALEIAIALEAAGFTTWYYERDGVPGVSYLVQTGQAIDNSNAVILIISANSLGSHQVTKEVVRAHEGAKPFLPVLVDVSHVEFQNRQPEWREAVGAATSVSVADRGLDAILSALVKGLTALHVTPTTMQQSEHNGGADATHAHPASAVSALSGTDIREQDSRAVTKPCEKQYDCALEFTGYALGVFVMDFEELLETGFGWKVTRFEVTLEARRETKVQNGVRMLRLFYATAKDPPGHSHCATHDRPLSAAKAGQWETVRFVTTHNAVTRAWIEYYCYGEQQESEVVCLRNVSTKRLLARA